MTPEVEFANRKIEALEQRINELMRKEDQLTVLPNKDLWRGNKVGTPGGNIPSPDAEHITTADPLNAAMANILKAAAGNKTLTCVWCGQQWDGANNEKAIREHLLTSHASVVKPMTDAAVLMHELGEAKEQLAKA